MAGIYLHIPFCKKACHYCDFHFSTLHENMGEMVEAICHEITLRKNYLSDEKIESIYFGGGTPSLLNEIQLVKLIRILHETFDVVADAEITLEANPDDLTKENLLIFKTSGINRLSIGIQSFREQDLIVMNRAHNVEQALMCVKDAKEAGFENISIDLIYGLPDMSGDDWRKNLEIAFSLDVDHLSCYSLTVEPKTALAKMIQQHKVSDIDDAQSALHFEMLMDETAIHNFEHYEISNFARHKKYSKHNTSYWQRKKYLGVGPSAHSFDGDTRQWNVYNNSIYLRTLKNSEIPFEREELTGKDKLNEYLLTSLRTMWGMNLNFVKNNFGNDAAFELEKKLSLLIDEQLVEVKDNNFILTRKGKYFADKISLQLFV